MGLMAASEDIIGEDIIARKQLQEYTRRNDWVAFVWLTGHVGAVGITGYLVYLGNYSE